MRPKSLLEYYAYAQSYSAYSEIQIKDRDDHQLWQIRIETPVGETTVDYYKRKQESDSLIFVFPVLGGRPVLSTYFADRFVKMGFDAAVVHRNNEFKSPEHFQNIESILRESVLRDRIALDFFEREKGKRTFGAFGISRGAINVAITAGVDPRLQYNVMAMGGTDLQDIFFQSRERRIKEYIQTVSEMYSLNEQEIYTILQKTLKTNPRHLAHYIDGKNAMIILATCDTAVPVSKGNALRVQTDFPETIYIMATHRIGILYSQFLKWFLPIEELCIFPYPYIEQEAEAFFRRSFGQKSTSFGISVTRVLQFPLNSLGYVYDMIYRAITDPESKQKNYRRDVWNAIP